MPCVECRTQKYGMHTFSRARYRAIKKEIVAAVVADNDTRMLPGTIPKMAPDAIVSGIAGTARTSRAAYTKKYRTYPAGPKSSTISVKNVKNDVIWSLKTTPPSMRIAAPPAAASRAQSFVCAGCSSPSAIESSGKTSAAHSSSSVEVMTSILHARPAVKSSACT